MAQLVVTENHYEQLEGLPEFLATVEVVVNNWDNESVKVIVYRRMVEHKNDIRYCDFYFDILTDPFARSAFYMSSDQYCIERVPEGLVQKVLGDEHRLQLTIQYPNRHQKKAGVTSGNITGILSAPILLLYQKSDTLHFHCFPKVRRACYCFPCS